MKSLTLPAPIAARLKLAYDALMADDLPMDFNKVSELIQSTGEVVRELERQACKAPRLRVRKINGQRFVQNESV